MQRRDALTIAIITAVALVAQNPLWGAAWQPAGAPLMTQWAGDVDPDHVLPEYPRPQMVRPNWRNLNGLWQFEEASEGDSVPIGRDLTGQILVPFPWESALSGVRQVFDSHRAWYRRRFTVPASWPKGRVLLHFGAVDWEATVYVNGACVGIHRGGYDPFTFDITAHLRDSGAQELIVGVYDPGTAGKIAKGKQANHKFADPGRYHYSPSSGIWQTVWLEAVPQTYISALHIVPDIDAGTVTVEVDAVGARGAVDVEIVAGDKRQMFGPVTGRANQPVTLAIPDPKLWSPDAPFLYDLAVQLKKNGRMLDTVQSYFGMRKISLGTWTHGVKRLHLNNEFLFQMGPLDQGYWPDGIYTAPTDEALRWDVEQIKAFGFNMIRKHVKVEPARWYYWCDKLGVLVWQDMPHAPGGRTDAEKDQFELELQRMVKGFWNHPSIIIWVVFNEHWGLYDVRRLTEDVMALDRSRLVTGNSGIDAGKPNLDFEVGHIRDNHSYRPPNCPFASDTRAIVCGEYGAIGYKIPGHIWDADGPWVHHNYVGKEAATVEYETFIKQLIPWRDAEGLSAAVYTQWTDVENEMNGLYTYDRKVIKLDQDRVTAANRSTWWKENGAQQPVD